MTVTINVNANGHGDWDNDNIVFLILVGSDHEVAVPAFIFALADYKFLQ